MLCFRLIGEKEREALKFKREVFALERFNFNFFIRELTVFVELKAADK